jgi:high-affinity Fe2+/Pb2+ permease
MILTGELVLACCVLIVMGLVEFHDRRGMRQRSKALTNFAMRDSVATTNSSLTSEPIVVFINQSDCYTSQLSRMAS